MEQGILNELKEIKNLTLLSAKKVLTMDDVSAYTGLSKSHLYKMVSAKRIPYWKNQGGKLTYFDKSEIENWMLHCHIEMNNEAEPQATSANNIFKEGGAA